MSSIFYLLGEIMTLLTTFIYLFIYFFFWGGGGGGGGGGVLGLSNCTSTAQALL